MKLQKMLKHFSLLLIAVLGLSSGVATAAMTLVDVSDRGNIFYDPATIRRNGSIATVWLVFTYKDYIESKGKHVKSSRVRMAFDCRNEQSQTQYNGLYLGRDGQGELIEALDYGVNSKWEIIDPDSTTYVLYALACSGKPLPKPLADLNAKFQNHQISERDYIEKRDAYLKTLK